MFDLFSQKHACDIEPKQELIMRFLFVKRIYNVKIFFQNTRFLFNT